MQTLSATYSPEDNKLRLYASSRLDSALYQRVNAAGFKWASKQDLFVAPAWSPDREDLLLELCGEIDDEDTSLVERAEQRADRFEDYSDKRGQDAESARQAVAAIADGIPFGQPILVGHHSEARARKDAERIENGMRRAVRLWETSEYWTRRAAGAIRAAKYKERPDVRARRIKGLEADKRKQERNRAEAEKFLKAYNDPEAKGAKLGDGRELLPALLGTYEGGLSFEQMRAFDRQELSFEEALPIAVKSLSARVEWANRWIAHIDNRLAYERAMLAEAGGTASDKVAPEKGGACRCWASPSGGLSYIVKVNKVSVTVLDNWGNGGENFTRTIPFDKLGALMSAAQVAEARAQGRLVETTDQTGFYLREAPTNTDSAEPATTTATPAAPAAAVPVGMPPRCNYPGAGFVHITMEEWNKIPKDYRGWGILNANGTTGAHKARRALGCYLLPDEKDMNKRHSYPNVYITDAKRVDPPSKAPAPATTDAAQAEPVPAPAAPAAPAAGAPVAREAFDAMRETLRAGVQVVSAPQLFPTPVDLARRMADLADIRPGMRVLEPSAGTGLLLGALGGRMFGHNPERGEVVAIEVNRDLSRRLRGEFPKTRVHCADFLSIDGPAALVGDVPAPVPLGDFDVIVMNPPFENGADIRHIRHALKMLKPGGRLVAICANGTRQNAQLRPLVEQYGGEWEDLPPDTFAVSGTGVNTALLTLTT
ncbi:DUF3560 domain-containing protein (plasmid) [Ralstonia pseudosolanacearum]